MFLAFDRYTSFLQLHQLLDNGKPKARSSVFSGDTGIGLTETFKNGIELFIWDTYSCINDFNTDPAYSLNALASAVQLTLIDPVCVNFTALLIRLIKI